MDMFKVEIKINQAKVKKLEEIEQRKQDRKDILSTDIKKGVEVEFVPENIKYFSGNTKKAQKQVLEYHKEYLNDSSNYILSLDYDYRGGRSPKNVYVYVRGRNSGHLKTNIYIRRELIKQKS